MAGHNNRWLDLLLENKSADFIAANGRTYLVDTTGGIVTVTLPPPAANLNIRIKDVGGEASGRPIIIEPDSGIATTEIEGVVGDYTMNWSYGSVTLISDGTHWFTLIDNKFREVQTISQQELEVDSANGHGSTNTFIRRFTNEVSNTGASLIKHTESAASGSEFEALQDCFVNVMYMDNHSGGTSAIGITLNSTQLTTDLRSVNPSDIKTSTETSGIYAAPFVATDCSATFKMNKGDIFRCHTNALSDTTTEAKVIVTATAQNDNVVVDGDTRMNSVSLVSHDGRAISGGSEDIFWSGSATGWVGGADGQPSYYEVQKDDSVIEIKGSALFTTDAQDLAWIYVNGVEYKAMRTLTVSNTGALPFGYISSKGEFSLGDKISIRNGTNRTLRTYAGTNVYHYLNINEVYNDQAIVVPIADPYENTFGARITNNGTAAILTQSVDFIQSVNRTAQGLVTITFKAGFFTVAPSITTSIDATTNRQFSVVDSVSTTQAVINTHDESSNDQDRNFAITVTRQGADYKEAKGYFLGEVATNRVETKYLQSDQVVNGSATLTDLQFNNLVIGQQYKVEMKGRFALGLIRYGRLRAQHNGSTIALVQVGNPGGSSGIDITGFDSAYFVATATTVTFDIFHGVANTGGPATETTKGNGTGEETYARLIEVNTDREVSGVF